MLISLRRCDEKPVKMLTIYDSANDLNARKCMDGYGRSGSRVAMRCE